ncbi:hypothetical protein [Leptospira sp. GIMC2001]|uniref:hypothetical protein n=1 Tax=Leptospira sp. GIMC2001 TaxID=1513297 RepID=UPI00234A3C1E|nr:hypothetical protein [Leptospira sp. GIMC2001]WCL48318.1 hypothetical protein O4O04_13510 [Leptospira sp. GIMC2001]
MKKLIRDNIVYILLVLFLWAITFPIVYWKRDWIFSKITYFWSPPGYKPDVAESFIGKGDAFLIPRGLSVTEKMKQVISADAPPTLPPIDLNLMTQVCNHAKQRQHSDPFLDSPTWNQKKEMLTGKIHVDDREMVLTFDPKLYWKTYNHLVLEALDYYKRALNYSGPEIRVPLRIESVARATCREAEILLAYTTHVYQTEEFIEQEYLKEELGRENPIRRPSWFRKIWNRIRGYKPLPERLPLESTLSRKQIQLRIWDKIRNGDVSEITRSDFVMSVGKTLRNVSKPLDVSSPREALEMYERLLFFVSNQNSPIEYRRYRNHRGEIYLRLAKAEPSNFAKAILEFRDASKIPNIDQVPPEILPALLVESFALELGIAKVYFQEKNYPKCLSYLNGMQEQLRNIDERSSSGSVEDKKSLLSEFRFIKKTSLRKLGRFEEADEIPD